MKDHQNPHVLCARPKISEMQFHLFGRVLHPELYDSFEARCFERGKYLARVDITGAGHIVRWTYDDRVTMTEVVTSSQSPLPQGRHLLKRRFQGKRDHIVEWRLGIRYRVSLQLEHVDREVLWMYQNELCHEGRKGMLHIFGSSGRVAFGGLSYVHVETRNRSLVVQSLHSFPDEQSLVKVESVFQVPS